jgi:hypothetical protein
MNKERWDRFLSGHWTKTPPTKEGSYPIAFGEASTEITPILFIWIIEKEDGIEYVNYNYVRKDYLEWGGYFWSEPMPNLPPPI